MEPPRPEPEDIGLDYYQFSQHIPQLVTLSTEAETSTSFTALLQLPPEHAVELLQSPNSSTPPIRTEEFNPNLDHPGNNRQRPAEFSANHVKPVKSEQQETESCLNSSQPLVLDPTTVERAPPHQGSSKRKEREHNNKVKGTSKKSKSDVNAGSVEGQILPYVHVRARRGQATDSHSLAERARREKINAKMKLLRELVPGCSKISGTALVLDEIINHVLSLQRQVELLSVRLAAVYSAIDFNIDSMLFAQGKSLVDSDFPYTVMPVTWPDVQANGNTPQYPQQWCSNTDHHSICGSEKGAHNFVTPENCLEL